MNRDCKNCYNCDFIWGFMATCHYSYDEEDADGNKWHYQCGQDVHRSRANKCKHYTEEKYDRDEIFVL